MTLFTEQQYQKLLENGKPENKDKDLPPVVEIFIPSNNNFWLLTRIEQSDNNIAFGLHDNREGYPVMNYLNLSSLDKYTGFIGSGKVFIKDCDTNYPLSVYEYASRLSDSITDNRELLELSAIKLGVNMPE